MNKEDKAVYFDLARKKDTVHKSKYPGKIISLNIQYSLVLHEIAK
jgi:hypothetical protein